jgi:D-alanyl-D-alanine carboxypeptidase (penicillin-binding protein 5/6)
VLEGRRRRRHWPIPVLGIIALALIVTLFGLSLGSDSGLEDGDGPRGGGGGGGEVSLSVAKAKASPKRKEDPSTDRYSLLPEAAPLPIEHEFADPPQAGLMFDVDTGEILWEHHPDRELPIASLTKMMTAHLIAERHAPDEKVLISADAPKTGGSMVGVLPVGEKVPLGALLKGLLLVSGNDAATALAEDDAGTVDKFVERMNDEADRLELSCSHFTTPHGLEDEGNYSCPRDLAALARADLSNPRIAAIARSDHESVPFPIPGGALELYNNNPFIRAGDPTITGLKTGYTDAAGRCYVTTAERGGRELGVVLLDSPDPLGQIPKLLELGEAAQ